MNGRIVAVFSGGGTGGHLYPALALASALTRRRPDVHPFFVGAVRGLEARVLPELGVDHLLVPVEGFRRGALLANLQVVRLLAIALAHVAQAIHRLRPQLVVVTGGYAGGPAGLVAVLTGTRLVLQEQNSMPGLTTRFLSRFAREVHLAFPESV
jgi:UDP-N-acetylglucosamine--N-acetylmuramyl-(pentapeptide) pyrophosphoryl-undecaprenol N-acetylglucosamine transferase